mgnify:CR=1 FL=1
MHEYAGAGSRNKLYCDMLLNIVAGYERAEISIVAAKEQTPWIIVVNGFFYIQILYQKEDDFAACFSTDPEVASMFRRIGREIFENAEQVFELCFAGKFKKNECTAGFLFLPPAEIVFQ